MDRGTRRLFLVAISLIVAIGLALALLGGDGGSGGPPDAPTMDGVVVNVESAGLNKVSSFTLRTMEGASVVFGLSELGNGVQFPPGHLAEHLATAQQIRVWYRTTDSGDLEALWLEDRSGG